MDCMEKPFGSSPVQTKNTESNESDADHQKDV